MRIFTLLFVVLLFILFAIFMILNAGQIVDVSFLGLDYSNIPLYAVVLYSFLTGAIFVLIIAIVNEIRLRRNLARERKENQRLKGELDSLRNLPVEEGEEE